MSRVEGKLAKTLLNKPRVITRAVFWKIPHNTQREDVRLKIGRYKKPTDFDFDLEEEPESLEPKSELTLDHEEFQALIEFLQQSYEPFKRGIKAFIPLDRPFDSENANQIRALFSLPDKRQLVRFILENDVIPMELAAGLRQAQRARAVGEFEAMLDKNLLEGAWQKWFQANNWVLGSQFVRILDERHIDTENISDFLMEAYDGFLDVVEIKRPDGGLQFWASARDHGNYVPSSDLTKAVTQASRYIYEVEREANSVKFLERVGGVKTVKPRCILIFGRSDDWSDEQAEAYRIMNAGFHNLTVLTYDHVLTRARRIVGLDG
jgi:hypothetical protein